VLSGDKGFAALERRAVDELARSGFRPDYVEVRRSTDLAKPSASDRAEELVVLGAAWLGRARLIDNLRI
jgi:pantoate--beta-alanine ligase